jgi:hypothetical protein
MQGRERPQEKQEIVKKQTNRKKGGSNFVLSLFFLSGISKGMPPKGKPPPNIAA